MRAAQTRASATVEDLYRVEGKAEIVNGELVLMSPTGSAPGWSMCVDDLFKGNNRG